MKIFRSPLRHRNEPRAFVLREHEAVSDAGFVLLSNIRRPHHLYRGVTSEEFEATVQKTGKVQSRGDYSHESEGTVYSDDPLDAESYVNFGRDDPRKTGRPTWLLEVAQPRGLRPAKDGYYKVHEPLRPARVWVMFARGDKVWIGEVR